MFEIAIEDIQRRIDELGIKIQELDKWMDEQIEAQRRRYELDDKIEELAAKK